VIDQINDFGAVGAKEVQLSFLDYPTGDGFDLFEREVLPTFASNKECSHATS
jgi:hypothetical protein